MPNPLTVGLRATARLEEAILLALEEYRDQGYLSTIRLAERIGWDNDGMPSPNGQGYGPRRRDRSALQAVSGWQGGAGSPAQPSRPLGRLADQR